MTTEHKRGVSITGLLSMAALLVGARIGGAQVIIESHCSREGEYHVYQWTVVNRGATPVVAWDFFLPATLKDIAAPAGWSYVVTPIANGAHIQWLAINPAQARINMSDELTGFVATSAAMPKPTPFTSRNDYFAQATGHTLGPAFDAVANYNLWAFSFGLSGTGAIPEADEDRDGIPNGIEYVTSNDPQEVNETDIFAWSVTDENLQLSFTRDSTIPEEQAALCIETSADLINWDTAFRFADGSGIASEYVTISEVRPGLEAITIAIPRNSSYRFARLTAKIVATKTVSGAVVLPNGAPGGGFQVWIRTSDGLYTASSISDATGAFSVADVPIAVDRVQIGGFGFVRDEKLYFRAKQQFIPSRIHTDLGVFIAESSAFAPIPGGGFQCGDSYAEGGSDEVPMHDVILSAFRIQVAETTKEEWDRVMAWARTHGYGIDSAGFAKAAEHPITQISWFDCVKWCNARSEMEGLIPCYYTDSLLKQVYRTGQMQLTNNRVNWSANGYRLPTEAEWEVAARGGREKLRFCSGEFISHSEANYYAFSPLVYDLSVGQGYHPLYSATGTARPFTSPVCAFPANGYGVFDLDGNVHEWCWDAYSDTYYNIAPTNNPRGPNPMQRRVVRGGSWKRAADWCRVAMRFETTPGSRFEELGFRTVIASD